MSNLELDNIEFKNRIITLSKYGYISSSGLLLFYLQNVVIISLGFLFFYFHESHSDLYSFFAFFFVSWSFLLFCFSHIHTIVLSNFNLYLFCELLCEVFFSILLGFFLFLVGLLIPFDIPIIFILFSSLVVLSHILHFKKNIHRFNKYFIFQKDFTIGKVNEITKEINDELDALKFKELSLYKRNIDGINIDRINIDGVENELKKIVDSKYYKIIRDNNCSNEKDYLDKTAKMREDILKEIYEENTITND